MLLLLHICRPCCPTLYADVVFTCLVKWWDSKALGNSKYHSGTLSSICVRGCYGFVQEGTGKCKISLEAAIFLEECSFSVTVNLY